MDAVVVDVEREERYWYPSDGGQVWLAGFQPVDPASGSFLARDSELLTARRVVIANVAGAAEHHAAALASDAVEPGAPLVLRRDAGNAYDENAVAVDLPSGEQLGYVPRTVAAELAPDLDAGRSWSALVLRERRPSPRGPRTGVTMLLAPGAALTLNVLG
ncbi:MAG TPA: HIRAN domain-containing protein [Solirubrobacteraceae bacterium]|nr:HIRAN domain-containing protein [Solirubrobacteraceae bacterium]